MDSLLLFIVVSCFLGIVGAIAIDYFTACAPGYHWRRLKEKFAGSTKKNAELVQHFRAEALKYKTAQEELAMVNATLTRDVKNLVNANIGLALRLDHVEAKWGEFCMIHGMEIGRLTVQEWTKIMVRPEKGISNASNAGKDQRDLREGLPQ